MKSLAPNSNRFGPLIASACAAAII